jgi:pyruvate formate lyase activating enzyme
MREGGEETQSLMDRAKCTPGAEPQGLIFNIQKFSLHDGPGIRTTIFMKGCPLQCRWCSNPESQNATVDIMTAGRNCIDCKRCLEVCPKGCIYEGEGKGKKIDRRLCDLCGKCVAVCPSKAIEKIGTSMTVEEVVEEIQKDETFYHHSGGGVTVSGGEPLLQWKFVLALFEACKKRHLHTVLDTSGYAPWDILGRVLHHVDLVLYDIKSMDGERHKEGTNVMNETILENAVRTAKMKRTWLRYVVVPGFNDSIECALRIGEFASLLRPEKVSLLPYHSLGAGKYERLGRAYPMGDIASPPEENLRRLADILSSFGTNVTISY